MKPLTLLLFTVLLGAAPVPRLEKSGGKYSLIVDGKPFLVLGAQVHNSSGWPETLERIWPQAQALHANTVEIPVYWESVEPRPGEFNFANVDTIVREARRRGFRLILLWFGTWKNGSMDYAPAWIKQDPSRYPRAIDASGRPTNALSPHGRATLEADGRAFSAFMSRLAEIDGDDRTVIMVQVENEAGGLKTVRDYSNAANSLFASPVPGALAKALGKQAGTWQEVFGRDADEAFSAWHVASYINEVARAGKKVYALPMYVNAWLRETPGWMRPAEDYPSGGPTSNVLDIWKAAAPDIDLIAPDIYLSDLATYHGICSRYRRPDNPLFIPETGTAPVFARYFFYAVGEYGAIGFAPFGFDRRDGSTLLEETLATHAANFKLVGPALPKILELQDTGKLKAAVEEQYVPRRLLTFSRYDMMVDFAGGTDAGRIFVGELAPDEFLLTGFDAQIYVRPRRGEKDQRAQLVTVEEGTFVDGQWKASRLINGDEVYPTVKLSPSGGMLRVRVMAY